MKLAIIQPIVPVYREDFFVELGKYVDFDVYVFKKSELCKKEQTNVSSLPTIYIKNRIVKGLLFYDMLPLLKGSYDGFVLMQSASHVSTWFLLLSKFFHRKKIILWGHGISISKYEKEQVKPNLFRKIQIMLSDGLWLYMNKEKEIWSKWLPSLPIVALNNTISGADRIASYDVLTTKKNLKNKYRIPQEKVIIFCARFENTYRRVDLLLEVIQKLDPVEFAFIIIGGGKCKPDFTIYKNVYDFGSVYDEYLKRELFTIADIYFQPGWVGLSIVEAMAYAKPICTFMRSINTLQCVEYSYIQHAINGFIFEDMEDCLTKLRNVTKEEYEKMGANARDFVARELTPKNMANNALENFNVIMNK
jgi:glycosyltransferase involved in cell wall biosynthesis